MYLTMISAPEVSGQPTSIDMQARIMGSTFSFERGYSPGIFWYYVRINRDHHLTSELHENTDGTIEPRVIVQSARDGIKSQDEYNDELFLIYTKPANDNQDIATHFNIVPGKITFITATFM